MKLRILAASALLIATGRADEVPFYIGSTGRPPEVQGIYRGTLDVDTGKLSAPVKVAEAKAASFLAIHPGGEFLYATAEGNPGSVAAFGIAEDGGLKPLNQQSSGGAGPTHIWIDSAGKNLLVANYTGGSIACLPIREDGSLSAQSVFVQHTGSSVNPQRQTAPHAHGIYTDPGDKFVYVPDLGIDKVLIYKFDVEKGTLLPNNPAAGTVEPGSGPRHFAFHPGGGFGYCINELSNTIDVFKHDPENGGLESIQTIPTLPVDFTDRSTTAEIFVHPNGRFVYGSNRGHDSIAVFSVADDTGKLRLVDHTSTRGKNPRNFSIDPTGKWLIAANQSSNDIFVYKIDPATGKLTATDQTAQLPSPMSIAFMPRQ